MEEGLEYATQQVSKRYFGPARRPIIAAIADLRTRYRDFLRQQ